MKNLTKITTLALLAVFIIPQGALAFRTEDLPNTEVKGDFVVGPGKTELFLDPGESAKREISVTNRLGRDMRFRVEIEDFTGSMDPNRTVVFYGNKKGPYSLRDYIQPETEEFTLAHGQRAVFDVNINIPEDAEPGGRYGSVIISTSPIVVDEDEVPGAGPQVAVVSRLANLLFVRVNGPVKEEGKLTGFKTTKSFYETGPVMFELLSENTGSVHLNNYGIVEVYNMLGKKVGEIQMDPWFVMPQSLRLREVAWESRNFLFGKYTAKASINRGYDDIVDVKETTFWVIPWKIIGLILVVLSTIIWAFLWMLRNFEIRKKK